MIIKWKDHIHPQLHSCQQQEATCLLVLHSQHSSLVLDANQPDMNKNPNQGFCEPLAHRYLRECRLGWEGKTYARWCRHDQLTLHSDLCE
jgi:hypothetical protein